MNGAGMAKCGWHGILVKKGWKGHYRLTGRRLDFFANYYLADSKTRGNGRQSAIAAGYAKKSASHTALYLLKAFNEAEFRLSLEAAGVTKPQIAFHLAKILKDGSPKDVLAASHLALDRMGERAEDANPLRGATFNAPAMVIVGLDQKSLNRLKQIPALPEVQSEPQSEILVVNTGTDAGDSKTGTEGG